MASHNYFLFALTLLLLLLIVLSATADQCETPAYGEEEGAPNRRSLFWNKAIHYYISYGALSANRIPCPPRSGRSYYTHNCHRARGPVHPYSRGCSAITHCRR
ncbi:protein RALF-like 34 [Salvia splendens]|uniref:protein RALF-like 34 n=1 Tax=Salvia splendens TaxID=180675 RepID=UPI001C27DC42|nr:protein RALF-like 34 [Salvia splendens]